MEFFKRNIKEIFFHIVLLVYLIFLYFKVSDSYNEAFIIAVSIFSGISIGAMILKTINSMIPNVWIQDYKNDMNSVIKNITYPMLAVLVYGFLLKSGIKKGEALNFFTFGFQSIFFCITALSLISMFVLNAAKSNLKRFSPLILALTIGISYFYFRQILGDFLYFDNKKIESVAFGLSVISDLFQASIAFILLKNIFKHDMTLLDSYEMQKFLFAITIFASYMFLSQYLIIYYWNKSGQMDLIAYKKSFTIVINIFVILKYIVPFLLLLTKRFRTKLSISICSVLSIILGTFVEFLWYSMFDLATFRNTFYYSFVLVLVFGIIFMLSSYNKRTKIQVEQ